MWLKSLIEGVCKMGILIAYMWAVSRMKEIKRLFMYHGAEHKTIACFEAELDFGKFDFRNTFVRVHIENSFKRRNCNLTHLVVRFAAAEQAL